MSGPTYTPGPWSSDAPPDDVSVDVDAPAYSTTAVGPEGRFPVALVVTLGWDDAKQEANTRLIAAAPDLFEALVQIVNGLDWSLLLESDDLPERKRAHAALLQAAESAIAKAKGEQP